MSPRTRLLQGAALLSGATAALAAWDCTLQLGSLHFDLNQVRPLRSSASAPLLLTSSTLRAGQGPGRVGDRVADPAHRPQGALALSLVLMTLSPTTTPSARPLTLGRPAARLQNRYALSLCDALPDPPASAPDDDCPHGTRLCMRAFSTRHGYDDRLLSVVPVAGELDGGSGSGLNPRAEEKDGSKPDERWVFEMGGGRYNGVDQKARIDMVCDAGARETAPTVDEYDAAGGILYLSWRTFAACPASSDAPPPDPPAGGGDGEGDKDKEGDRDEPDRDPVGHSRGLGFFGWFFTLLFVALLAYFGLGAYHNYSTYGATGWGASDLHLLFSCSRSSREAR